MDTLYESGQIGEIGFFWLDAQWSEHLVLQGGEKMLTKCRPKILMEYTPASELCEDNVSVSKWRGGTPKMLMNDPLFENVFSRQPLHVSEESKYFQDILLEYELAENAVYIGTSPTESMKVVELDKEYPPETEMYFVHGYNDEFKAEFVGNYVHITRVDQQSGWSQDLIGYIQN